MPSRLLVFSRTTAYRHASIEAGVATVRELCAARVLAKVDESSYVGGTMGDDHPIVWCHDHEGGRSFYTAMGHTEASFAEVAFREHLRGAVRWAFHRS